MNRDDGGNWAATANDLTAMDGQAGAGFPASQNRGGRRASGRQREGKENESFEFCFWFWFLLFS